MSISEINVQMSKVDIRCLCIVKFNTPIFVYNDHLLKNEENEMKADIVKTKFNIQYS